MDFDDLLSDGKRFEKQTQQPEPTKPERKVANHPLNTLGVSNCFVAGGAVTSFRTKKQIMDYDIYPKNSEGLMEVLEVLHSCGVLVNMTDRSATYKHNTETDSEGNRAIYQVIMGYYPTAQDIFENFDFSVCMGAFDCGTGEFFYGEGYLEDLASRTMRFNPGTKYPLASLVRVAKYNAKGYYMPKAETIRMALTLGQTPLPTSWEELSACVGGVYGKSCEIAGEDEEFSIDKAMEILADMESQNFYYEDKVDEYKGYTADDVFAMFDETEGTIYIKTDHKVYYQNDKTKVCGYCDIKNIPKHWIELDDNYLIKTYKYVNKIEPGVYSPAIHKSEIKYYLGELTKWDKSPWIYCGKDIKNYAKPSYISQNVGERVCVSVLIKPSDIMAFDMNGRHIQAREIFIFSELIGDEKPSENFEICHNRRL